MNNKEITTFAETTFRNQKQKFGIKIDDRRRHMYLIGKTGMGKSTILENMIVEDMRAGNGVAVVDPHGDLAEKVMQYIPEDRVKDVIYFNPADLEYPIAFNIVEQVDIRVRHLVASGLIGVFKKLWADSWGPRLEYILRNAILAILDFPGSTLLDVIRLLSDKPFRKKVIAQVQDPVVKSFWQKEFAGYADKFATEAVSPIQNKVGQFLSSALIRNIVGQERSSIDMRKIMDEGKILIMNLSKGRIGEDNSSLLGAMMITKIQLAAMSRVDIPEKERRDFYLYIDEFQNFSTDSFANILSEARKYHLNLILAHQYIEQLSESVKPAVFGNVGTLIVFRVGAADAEELVKEFTPTFLEEDIVNIPKYEFYLKLMIDGVASNPFSARGLPPLKGEEKTNNFDKAIEYTHQTYAFNRKEVEEAIMSSHFKEDIPVKAPSPLLTSAPVPPPDFNPPLTREKASAPEFLEKKPLPAASFPPAANNPPSLKSDFNSTLSGFSATCSLCGVKTSIPFKPDGVRPVYCKKCLSDLKNKKKEAFSPQKTLPGKKIDFSQIPPSILEKLKNSEKSAAPEKVNVLKIEPAKEAEKKAEEPPSFGLTEEKKEIEEENILPLSDLSKRKAVDFKGREIKNYPPEKEEPAKEELLLSSLSPAADEESGKEKDLAEGEDIFFD